ncbi:hypothetical protein GCM10023184_11600 [Flaviaesturariibacter amylovorans]|uniref:Tetratricopeptide repeat protein n=1 Tax=Flaviaesturariibacter amylovorans TaxID=1084520 RepID=A0ABP8GH34_9BACT
MTLVLLASCASNEPSLLEEPPYRALTDSIRQKPGEPELFYRRGQLLFENGETELARTDITRAWGLLPREDFALSIATVLEKKSSDSALHFLEGAHRRVPGSVAISIALAKAYRGKGQPANALALCDSVIRRYPNALDALVLKSELQKEGGQDADAIRTLEQAYGYAPFDAELAHSLAFSYAQAGNPKALSLSDSLIRADSLKIHAEPYYFKALYHEGRSESAQALALLDEAIAHDYNFLDAHMEKGQLLYAQKQYAPALQAFQLAIRITPTFADAYFWIGKSLEAMGNNAEAKINYQRAYGLDKTNAEAKAAADRL